MESIEAWKEVHSHLLLSITLTKDSINCEKAKRRLLLEELYKHITPEGISLWNEQRSSKKESGTRKKKSADGSVLDRDNGNTKSKIQKNSSSTSLLKKRKSAPKNKKQQNNADISTKMAACGSNEQAGSIGAITEIDQSHQSSPRTKKTKTKQLDRENMNNNDNNIQSLNMPASYFPHSFSGSLQHQNNFPPASNSFFNYPIAYNAVETSAMDAAAAVASALSAQSLSSANNNQVHPTFNDHPFQENETDNSRRQGGFEEVHEEEYDEEDDDSDD